MELEERSTCGLILLLVWVVYVFIYVNSNFVMPVYCIESQFNTVFLTVLISNNC